MPFLTGSISVRTYKVAEAPPDGYLDEFTKALKRHAFRPIDDARGQTESGGWVNARNLLDASMRENTWHFPPYILLGYRRDKKVLPAQMFRARLNDALRRLMRDERRTTVSKDERARLEASLREEMLRQTMPASSVTEAAWNLETGRLYIASTASTPNDAIVAIFTDTFGYSLAPQLPYLVAEEYAENHRRKRALERLHTADFTEAIHRRPAAPVRIEEIGS